MKYRTLLTAGLIGASALGMAQSIISSTGYGNVTPYTYNGASANYIPGQGVQVALPNPDALLKIDLPQGSNWTAYSHLQMTVRTLSTTAEYVFFAIGSTGIWCFTEIELAPNSQRRIIIPFDNAPFSGQWGYPQPVGNSAFQVYA